MKNLMVVMLGLLVLSPSVAFATNPAPTAATATSTATGGNVGAITNNGGTHLQTTTVAPVIAPVQTTIVTPTQIQGPQTQVGIQDQKTKQTNKQNTTVSVDASTGDTPRQAPSMAIMGAVSNASCMAHVGGGATTPFGGLQLIVPKLDEGCDSRAFADRLIQYGYEDVAIELLRSHDKVEKAFQAVQKRKSTSAVAPKATALQGEVLGITQQVLSPRIESVVESN